MPTVSTEVRDDSDPAGAGDRDPEERLRQLITSTRAHRDPRARRGRPPRGRDPRPAAPVSANGSSTGCACTSISCVGTLDELRPLAGCAT